VETLDLALDGAWLAGIALAVTRVAAFAVASPALTRPIPTAGRLAVVLSLGFFLAEPVPGALTVPALLAAAVVNAVVGIALGFLTGVVFHLFAVAGGLVDLTSGLSVAALFDPAMSTQSAVFGRMFNMVAIVLFHLAGGLEVIVRGLAFSVQGIALDGQLAPDAGLADVAVRLVSRLLVTGTEIALPVVAALFLVEVVLGLASRFAPQANVFLLGLPAKLLVTFSVVSVALLLFPEAIDGLLRLTADTFTQTLQGLGG
jgi:flagellar biosynthesis protein FliR